MDGAERGVKEEERYEEDEEKAAVHMMPEGINKLIWQSYTAI